MGRIKDTTYKFDGRKLKPFLTASPEETAEQLGISYGYLRLILSGHKTPSTDLATTICSKLNVPIEALTVSK